MKLKTILLAGVGVTAGMVVANYLTHGAVFEAVSGAFSGIKDAVSKKTEDTAAVLVDAAEEVADVVEDVAESI